MADTSQGQDIESLKEELASLRAENKALKEGQQLQADFFSGITHEIRTPLTAILGYAESLLDPDMKLRERLDAIKTIITSGRHLLSLINNLLDMAKSDAGKLSIELQGCSPLGFTSEVFHMFTKPAEDKHLELNIRFDSVIPQEIRTDETRVKSMLINLLGNAIKFTPQGRVEIALGYDPDSQSMQFTVSDSGIGMTDEQLAKVFSRYAQASSQTRFNFGGTGLGLYLCKRFAEELGGNIAATSEHGAGSDFSFTIPCNVDDPDLIEGQILRAEQVQSVLPPKLLGNVLIAEDVVANQQLFSMYVRRTGASVEIACNGAEAVEKVKDGDFHLVLMDIQMPIMNGIEATREIRKINPDIPILGLSANAKLSDTADLLEAGCNDYLIKPIQRHTFFWTLEQFLPRESEQSEDQTPIYSELQDENIPNLKELLDIFVKELSDTLVDMEVFYENEDWPSLRGAAHRLKGSAGGFGYPVLTDMAGQLEFQILSNNMENAKQYYDITVNVGNRIVAGAKESE